MTKQNFWFVILSACKCKKCPDLIDEYEFKIWPACCLVMEPQLGLYIVPLMENFGLGIVDACEGKKSTDSR